MPNHPDDITQRAPLFVLAFTDGVIADPQPRPLADSFRLSVGAPGLRPIPATWRHREAFRLERFGEYQRLCWERESFWTSELGISVQQAHYPHVSQTNPKLVAFTPDDAKGERDIQIVVKPGRFLRRFFGTVLTEKQIAHYAAWMTRGAYPTAATGYPLSWADTPEEIEAVYRHGPDSCMSGSMAWCTGVYGAGDLSVAYLTDPDTGRIVARALTWPGERKAVGRVYPTADRWSADGFGSRDESLAIRDALSTRLRAEGYTSIADRPDGFDGARLVREPDPNSPGDTVIVPYLDGDYGFDDDGDFLILRVDGQHRGCNPTGSVRVADAEEEDQEDLCDSCAWSSGSMGAVHTSVNHRGVPGDHENWCEACREADTWFCSGNEVSFSNGVEDVEGPTGERAALRWAERYWFYSDLADAWFYAHADAPEGEEDPEEGVLSGASLYAATVDARQLSLTLAAQDAP